MKLTTLRVTSKADVSRRRVPRKILVPGLDTGRGEFSSRLVRFGFLFLGYSQPVDDGALSSRKKTESVPQSRSLSMNEALSYLLRPN
jgi:hypothetical protein